MREGVFGAVAEEPRVNKAEGEVFITSGRDAEPGGLQDFQKRLAHVQQLQPSGLKRLLIPLRHLQSEKLHSMNQRERRCLAATALRR